MNQVKVVLRYIVLVVLSALLSYWTITAIVNWPIVAVPAAAGLLGLFAAAYIGDRRRLEREQAKTAELRANALEWIQTADIVAKNAPGFANAFTVSAGVTINENGAWRGVEVKVVLDDQVLEFDLLPAHAILLADTLVRNAALAEAKRPDDAPAEGAG